MAAKDRKCSVATTSGLHKKQCAANCGKEIQFLWTHSQDGPKQVMFLNDGLAQALEVDKAMNGYSSLCVSNEWLFIG